MYISRALLLLLLLTFLFFPLLLQWTFSSEGSWYRPYLVWLLLTIVAFFIYHKRQSHEF